MVMQDRCVGTASTMRQTVRQQRVQAIARRDLFRTLLSPHRRLICRYDALAEVECAVSGGDIGPQALWNEVCQCLAPGRRMFVPGGLFSGLREHNVSAELQRLYAILDDALPPPSPPDAPHDGGRG